MAYLSKSCLPANWGKSPFSPPVVCWEALWQPVLSPRTSHIFVTAAGETGAVMAPSLSTGRGCQVVVNLSSIFLDPSTTQGAPSHQDVPLQSNCELSSPCGTSYPGPQCFSLDIFKQHHIQWTADSGKIKPDKSLPNLYED